MTGAQNPLLAAQRDLPQLRRDAAAQRTTGWPIDATPPHRTDGGRNSSRPLRASVPAAYRTASAFSFPAGGFPAS